MKLKSALRILPIALVLVVLLLPLAGLRLAAASSTETLRPMGTGDMTGNYMWQYPDSGDHWDKVDEETADEDATYVYSITYMWDDDLYQIADLSVGSATINSVTVWARSRIGSCGGCWGYDLRIHIKTHGEVYSTLAIYETDTWANYSKVYTTNPYTGTAWTVSEVNDMQAGIGLWAGPAMCTQVWVVVDYSGGATPTPSASPTPTPSASPTPTPSASPTPTPSASPTPTPSSSPPTDPAITTQAATDIAQTSARLNSVVTTDGGEGCYVRWGYGKVSQTAENFDDYTVVTSWVGVYTTGQHPYLDLGGLDIDDTYYFRAQIKNTHATVTGDELSFDTLAGVGSPTGLRGYPSSTYIDLSWTKGAGASISIVRCRTDTFPTSYADGQAVYEGGANNSKHTGLTSGTTYYYAVWGASGSTYSAGSSQALVTTTAPAPTVETLEPPEGPRGWISAPDYTHMAGLGPIYAAMNAAADALSMPRGIWWLIIAMFLAVGVGIILYLVGRNSITLGLIGLVATLVIQWAQYIVPFWIVFIVLIIAISAFLVHRRETG